MKIFLILFTLAKLNAFHVLAFNTNHFFMLQIETSKKAPIDKNILFFSLFSTFFCCYDT